MDVVAAHIQRITDQGSDRFVTLHRRKDGSTFPVDINVTFVPIANGRIVGFMRELGK